MTERYTHGHPDAVLRSHRWRTVENSAAYLLPRLQAGVSLLDVGCGPGTITADFAARVSPGAVLGIDSSSDVVAAAARDHAAPNLSFAVGDVYDLDLPAESFDVVHAHQLLQHLSDPVSALGELRRVCRRGGVVAVRDADYEAMEWWPESAAITEWLDLYRTVARANGGEPDAGRYLATWARSAGFSDVDPYASAWRFVEPEDRRWWSETWAQRTEHSPLADRAVELGLATRGDLARVAAGWREWGEAPEGSFVVMHAEVLATP